MISTSGRVHAASSKIVPSCDTKFRTKKLHCFNLPPHPKISKCLCTSQTHVVRPRPSTTTVRPGPKEDHIQDGGPTAGARFLEKEAVPSRDHILQHKKATSHLHRIWHFCRYSTFPSVRSLPTGRKFCGCGLCGAGAPCARISNLSRDLSNAVYPRPRDPQLRCCRSG